MKPAEEREEVLFAEALKRPGGGAREGFLDGVCLGDQSLRARLEALIQAHERSDSFLETKPMANEVKTLVLPPEEGPGTVIGRYNILEKVGEGGFGVVYVAEQREPVKRRVAIKIIKLGMDTRQVVARFEAERQALALLDEMRRIIREREPMRPSTRLSQTGAAQPSGSGDSALRTPNSAMDAAERAPCAPEPVWSRDDPGLSGLAGEQSRGGSRVAE